nr:cytochrome c [Myxococcota bacterium]
GHDSDLWVATSAGLRLFRDGALSPVELAERDLSGALIAPAGAGAIWLVAEGSLLRVTIDAAGALGATSYERPGGITSITSDARGVPWMIAGGALHALETDGTLLRFEIPETLVAARASGAGPDVWVEGETGAWHAMGRVARPVHGMGDAAAPLAGLDGDAFVLGNGGVDRFRARHRVALEGITEGARIAHRVDAQIVLDVEEGAQILARIDRNPVELDGTTVPIDPATIGVGDHRLDVIVSWSDGTLPTTTTRRFVVAPAVTWTEHVRPIYVEQCADCHGAAGPSPTRLDAREDWQMHIERILDNVETGRMPLGRPALSADAIALIRTWSATGFPE